jgi:putative serine protease PepD
MQDYNSQPISGADPASSERQPTPSEPAVSGEPVYGRPRVTAPLPVMPPLAGMAYNTTTPPPSASAAQAPARQRPPKRGGVGMLMLAFLMMLGLVAGGIGGGATAWTLAQANAPQAAAPAASAPSSNVQTVENQNSSAIGSLYTRVSNSVVSVQTTLGNGRFSGAGEGSGIVVDQTHVLTNYHVVQGANTIRIVLADGTSVTATVVGSAPQDDLALLSAHLPADKVQPATLGDSDSAQVGDEVVAIGNPFGLDHTVTAGIISAINRSWSSGNQPVRPMIQTDAPINPGNSGGPLFNMQGQVIGINTAIESPVEGSVGVGFAIPINRAKSLLPQLSQGSTIQRVWLGISGISLNADVASQVNAPVSKGVLVAGVTDNSPAAKAGVQGSDPTTSSTLGDIITAIDGNAVGTVEDLTNYLTNKHSGDTVTLTILRGGQQQQVKVTLEPWPAQQSSSGQNPNGLPSPFDPNGQGNQGTTP